MIFEEEYEIERICAKIINDHLSFKAYPKTFATLSENNEDLEDINFRKQIMTFIKNKESLKALECVKNDNLKKLLLKQSFLELIEKNEVDEALRPGNEYLTKYENDDIFAVIGYDSLDNNEIKHFFEEKAAIDLANTINESLFESKKGRTASLLMIAWFHYKSIQSFLNK